MLYIDILLHLMAKDDFIIWIYHVPFAHLLADELLSWLYI